MATDEIWKPLPGYPRYMISNYGRVRGLKNQFIGSIDERGYMRFTARAEDGNTYNHSIHRAVALTFLGDPPFPEAVVRHLDGNQVNNTEDNLKWGTLVENHADSVSHGSIVTKLTQDDVDLIREHIYAGELTQKEIAKLFSVSQPTITQIKHNKIWRH